MATLLLERMKMTMNKEELLAKHKGYNLTNGHVKLIDIMGDDSDIVDAARVSYMKGTRPVSENTELIRYLMRNKHSSPFEMCEIKFRLEVPLDLARQLQRHRTAQYSSFNEQSTRYSIVEDAMAKTEANKWRKQSKNNKQGSDGYIANEWPNFTTEDLTNFEVLTDSTSQGMRLALYKEEQEAGWTPGEYLSYREMTLQDLAKDIYKERLMFGVAREQARKELPMSQMTIFYWKCDLWNLLHFQELRMDSHAQEEIRELANIVALILEDWVPAAWQAFIDYRLNSITFSANEFEVLWTLGNAHPSLDAGCQWLFNASQEERVAFLSSYRLTSLSERYDFITKLRKHISRVKEKNVHRPSKEGLSS